MKLCLLQMETFEEYLRARRTRSEALSNGSAHGSANGEANAGNHLGASAESVARARARMRALKNWRRAKFAVTRKITQDMLGVQRKCGRSFLSPCLEAGPSQPT